MSIHSSRMWALWVILAAFALEASAQQPALPAKPKADPAPKLTWPPAEWEEWVGSVSGGKFEFDRLSPLTEETVRKHTTHQGPFPVGYEAELVRQALIAKHFKAPTFVWLTMKREKDGKFTGRISYPSGLRSFELAVSGRIEKGQATFTEEIDPKNRPQWHPFPWRFTGTVTGDRWTGDISGASFDFLYQQR